MQRSKAAENNLLVSAIFLGVALRFYALNQPQLWLDELIQLLCFSQSTWTGSLHFLVQQPAAAPLDYILQNLFVQIWGRTELGARFHAALFGCLSLPLFYLIGLRLLSRREAVIGTFILAVYPLHIFYSREGRNYSLFVFLALLTFYLLLRALERKGLLDWTFFGGAWVLTLYTNYLAGLILFAQVLVVLLWYFFPRSSRGLAVKLSHSDLIRCLVSLLVAVTFFVPWVLLTIEQARGSFSEVFLSGRFLLRVWRELSGGSSPLSLTLMILIALGLWRLRSERRNGVLLLLGAWFLIPVLGVFLLDSGRGYFFAIRQILVAAPALIVLSAAAFGGSRSSYKGIPALTLLLVAVLGIGTLALSDRKEEADWKGLVRHLKKTKSTADWIVAPDIERVLALLYPEFNRRKLFPEQLEDRLERISEHAVWVGKDLLERIQVVNYLPLLRRRVGSESLLATQRVIGSTHLKGFQVDLIEVPRDRSPSAGPAR